MSKVTEHAVNMMVKGFFNTELKILPVHVQEQKLAEFTKDVMTLASRHGVDWNDENHSDQKS